MGITTINLIELNNLYKNNNQNRISYIKTIIFINKDNNIIRVNHHHKIRSIQLVE